MQWVGQKRMWGSFGCYLELKGSLPGRRELLSALGSPQTSPRKQHRAAAYIQHSADLALLAQPTWLA